MKFQISTDYAVRILQFLYINKDTLLTATTIAESTGVTYPFFIKIANQLKKKGLLKSIHGRNGGYLLGKSAHKISLYDVFLCIEGELQFCPCLKNGRSCLRVEAGPCNLHTFLYELQGKVIAEMSSQSIADLAS